jgi:hypothetical protein
MLIRKNEECIQEIQDHAGPWFAQTALGILNAQVWGRGGGRGVPDYKMGGVWGRHVRQSKIVSFVKACV